MPYSGNWVFMVGQWGGHAYPVLLQSHGGEGGLAAWLILLWYAVCFSCWNLNCVVSLRLLCSILLWLCMPEGGTSPSQRDLEEIREGGILLKMRIRQHQKWNWDVQVAFPRCLGGGWCPCVSQQIFLCWKEAPFIVMERSWHFYSTASREEQNKGHCLWRKARVTTQLLSEAEDQRDNFHPNCIAIRGSPHSASSIQLHKKN